MAELADILKAVESFRGGTSEELVLQTLSKVGLPANSQKVLRKFIRSVQPGNFAQQAPSLLQSLVSDIDDVKLRIDQFNKLKLALVKALQDVQKLNLPKLGS